MSLLENGIACIGKNSFSKKERMRTLFLLALIRGDRGLSDRLHLSDALGGRSLHLITRLRSIFRGALGLESLGVKNAIVTETAIGKCLRIIFEGIGGRLGSGVVNIEQLILLHQHELNVRPYPLD